MQKLACEATAATEPALAAAARRSTLDREERRDRRRSQRQSRQPAAESVARAPGDPERGEDHHGVRINLVSSRFTGKLEGLMWRAMESTKAMISPCGYR